MTQQLFERIIGEPPPSTVDVEQIIRRERRGRRRRWLGGAGAGLAAAAVTLSIGAVGAARTGGPPPSGAQPPATVPAPSSVDPGRDVRDSSERLSRAMREAVRRVAPAAELAGAPGRAPLFVKGLRLETRTNVPSPRVGGMLPKGDVFVGGADVWVGDRHGHLNIEVSMGAHHPALACGPPRKQPGCSEVEGPGGAQVIRLTTGKVVADRQGTAYTVIAQFADGRAVQIEHDNLVRGEQRAGGRLSARPPLSVDQLTRIALDPALVP
jgi:hypothetical protein